MADLIVLVGVICVTYCIVNCVFIYIHMCIYNTPSVMFYIHIKTLLKIRCEWWPENQENSRTRPKSGVDYWVMCGCACFGMFGELLLAGRTVEIIMANVRMLI